MKEKEYGFKMTGKNLDQKKSNRGIWGLAAAVVVVLALLIVAYHAFGAKTSQGAKHITVEVVDDMGDITSYDVRTDAEYLRQALEETEDLLVEGTESDYGLMIETVNGLTADYAADGAYWAIYVNGEYGNYGVDQQPVTDGDAYRLEYSSDQ